MTQSQIAFAEALEDPSVLTVKEAYRIAYSNNNMSDHAAAAEASKLKRNPKIVAYIAEKRNAKKAELLRSREGKRNLVDDKLVAAMEVSPDTTPSSRNKAIELYMKLNDLGQELTADKADIPKTASEIMQRMLSIIESAQNREEPKPIKHIEATLLDDNEDG